MKKIQIKDFSIGEKEKLCVIAGPCIIESKEHALSSAKTLKEIFSHHNINFIYKASYDKANRSSVHSFRGPGLKKGLQIIQEVKEKFDLPILADIHHPEEAPLAAKICDILQIPAFLSRQTDLLLAAAKTKSAINVKKGQFMSPYDMKNVIEKILFLKNDRILLTDRGTCFGYHNLISDMTAIPIMKSFGFPVAFDATHSVQKPSALGNISGGAREFIPTLIRSAIAAGCNVLFLEAHSNPKYAKSDPSTVLSFDSLKKILHDVEKLYQTVQTLHA